METGAPRRRYHALDGSGGTQTAPVECALDTISGSSPPSLKPTPRPGRVCFAIGKLTLQFVKASRQGDPELGGVAGYRLVQVPLG